MAINMNKSNRISKSYTKVLLTLLVCLIIIGVGVGFYINSSLEPLNPKDISNYDIEIPPGSSAYSIGQILVKHKIIDNDSIFSLYIKFNQLGSKLKAGHYSLSPSMSIPTIAQELVNGKGVTLKFTIPEGYDLKGISNVLTSAGIMNEDEFWQLVSEEDFSEITFVKDLKKGPNRLEGFLFPDTYIIDKGTSPREVIKVMLQRFEQVYNQLPTNESGLTFTETVTLASLIEKEARVDKDRPLIASVYLNRLQQNMYLQCDATVQYALPEHKERLFFSDYEIDSPYNTYRNPGLPPGPIASPGEKSLIAAHQPADTDYLFYLWDKTGNGEHVFAKNHKEHVENREKYGYN